MVLIVVFVHAVAAGEVEVGAVRLECLAHDFDVELVIVVVDRVGLGLADDAAIDNIFGRSEADLFQLSFG